MSKEREFLKKLRYASLLENDLRKELEELLAQPERTPLTREEISQGFRDNEDALNAESYWAGVKYAEKMHGVNNEISTT